MMFNEKIREFIHRNAGYGAAILASAVYLATSFVRIDKTGKSVYQIIVDSAIIFMIGFFIHRVFDIQGLLIGERNELYQKSMRLHGEAVIKVAPDLDKLDDWCFLKNADNLRVQRIRILSEEGLRYGEYFEPDGSLKDGAFVDLDAITSKNMKRIYRRRNRCVEKALRIKLTRLSAAELTSEGVNANDPYNFGRTKRKYEQQSSAQAAISKAGSALIFGYYGVSLLEDFSYANLIWNAMQVAMFVLIGAVAMYNSYLFITNEHRGRIVKKINCLEMFECYRKKKYPNENKEGSDEESLEIY